MEQWVGEPHYQVRIAHGKQLLFDRPVRPEQDAGEHDDEREERLLVRVPFFAVASFQPG